MKTYYIEIEEFDKPCRVWKKGFSLEGAKKELQHIAKLKLKKRKDVHICNLDFGYSTISQNIKTRDGRFTVSLITSDEMMLMVEEPEKDNWFKLRIYPQKKLKIMSYIGHTDSYFIKHLACTMPMLKNHRNGYRYSLKIIKVAVPTSQHSPILDNRQIRMTGWLYRSPLTMRRGKRKGISNSDKVL